MHHFWQSGGIPQLIHGNFAGVRGIRSSTTRSVLVFAKDSTRLSRRLLYVSSQASCHFSLQNNVFYSIKMLRVPGRSKLDLWPLAEIAQCFSLSRDVSGTNQCIYLRGPFSSPAKLDARSDALQRLKHLVELDQLVQPTSLQSSQPVDCVRHSAATTTTNESQESQESQ